MTYMVTRAFATGSSWQDAFDNLFAGLGGPPDQGTVKIHSFVNSYGVTIYQAEWRA